MVWDQMKLERNIWRELALAPLGEHDETLTMPRHAQLTRVAEARLLAKRLPDKEPNPQAPTPPSAGSGIVDQMKYYWEKTGNQKGVPPEHHIPTAIERMEAFITRRLEEQKEVEVGERQFDQEMRRQRETWAHAIHQLLVAEHTQMRTLIYALHEEIRRNPELEVVLGQALRSLQQHEHVLKGLEQRFTDPVTKKLDYERDERWQEVLKGIFDLYMQNLRP